MHVPASQDALSRDKPFSRHAKINFRFFIRIIAPPFFEEYGRRFSLGAGSPSQRHARGCAHKAASGILVPQTARLTGSSDHRRGISRRPPARAEIEGVTGTQRQRSVRGTGGFPVLLHRNPLGSERTAARLRV